MYDHIYLKGITPQEALKGTILLEGQEKRKERKTRKSRSEKKVVGFSSASIVPARN